MLVLYMCRCSFKRNLNFGPYHDSRKLRQTCRVGGQLIDDPYYYSGPSFVRLRYTIMTLRLDSSLHVNIYNIIVDQQHHAVLKMCAVTYIKLLILESERSYKPLTLLLLRLNLHSHSFVHVPSVKINFNMLLIDSSHTVL